jgi:hypothetical protein
MTTRMATARIAPSRNGKNEEKIRDRDGWRGGNGGYNRVKRYWVGVGDCIKSCARINLVIGIPNMSVNTDSQECGGC